MPNVNEVWYHKSQEWTAFVWLDEWNPESVREDEEYLTLIVQKDGKYGTLGFVQGEQNGSIWFEDWMLKIKDSLPTNITIAGWAHTHSKYGSWMSEFWGSGDVRITDKYKLIGYLGTPTGNFEMLAPLTAVHVQGHAYSGKHLGKLPPSVAYH